tara:strand:+ start:1512 stop:3191 length:1680 start_codon:yes stop_codon:yes gene_type:complete
MMKFSNLYLMSSTEHRALKIQFDQKITVFKANNGFGKSALLKSLYNVFGAEPHRIDDSWKNANVVTLLDFEIDGVQRSVLNFANTFTFFNANGLREFQSSSRTRGLGPFIADLLQFRLSMTDQKQNVVVPPPAYAFAPFYIDQDKSWSSAWDSFKGMYLPNSKKVLAEYHSGLKPNAFYVAQALRDQISLKIKEETERKNGLADAIAHLDTVEEETGIYFDLAYYKSETDRLLGESRELYENQSAFRSKLSELGEARSLWSAQAGVARAALKETDLAFKRSIGEEQTIECPTCGEEYENDILTRFGIEADSQSLLAILRNAEIEIESLDREIESTQATSNLFNASIAKINAILSTRRNNITLEQVIAAEGRNAATSSLRGQLGIVTNKISELEGKRAEQAESMRESQDRKQQKIIKDYFESQIVRNASQLDVRIAPRERRKINSAVLSRGSEGPRGLAAYYYAFLNTERRFGSSVFCPIVIDAPNQQGQDKDHLPAIIRFFVEQKPPGAQLIMGVEEAVGLDNTEATIIEVGERKHQLLNDESYTEVSSHMKHYIDQIV